MSAESRRNAIRRYGRQQATGLFLGVLFLSAFFLFERVAQSWLRATLGENIFFWGSGLIMFASLLIPPIWFRYLAVMDGWMYCPHCGGFFGAVRAVFCLNKRSQCNRCSAEVEIAPINKRHALSDNAYLIGGSLGVLAVMFAVSRVM